MNRREFVRSFLTTAALATGLAKTELSLSRDKFELYPYQKLTMEWLSRPPKYKIIYRARHQGKSETLRLVEEMCRHDGFTVYRDNISG